MEYQRIGKVQTGIISPSKLRIKLMGPQHHKKKDGSNCNSSRTSPSRLEDAEFVKNSLLASENDNLDDEVTSSSLEVLALKPSSGAVLHQRHSDQTSCEPGEITPKGNGNVGNVKMQHFQMVDNSKSSSIHQVRNTEDENVDYDSNASSSGFEFHRRERPVSNPATRFLLRPIPSKWNDAEKWIMNRQNIQANYQKKNALHSQANRFPTTSMMRFAPKIGYYGHKLPNIDKVTEAEAVDFFQRTSHTGFEKFSFIPAEAHPISGQPHGRIPVVEPFPQSKDSKEVNELDKLCSRSTDNQTAIPGIRSVAMRDMGTEMTPVTSQGQSRISTPVDSATPLRSPISSMPSTPRQAAPATTSLDNTTVEDTQSPFENAKKQLSEEDLKLKTRKEIQALGLHLGKMNIAAWASKAEREEEKPSSQDLSAEDSKRIEFEKRAASWEEAEKSKHTARYKREEIKIQAWESQQKAKLEAEARRIEAKVEQMRAQAQARTVKRNAMTRQKSEEKHAAAEARRNQEETRTAAKAEYIRQTGRMPSSNYICCCWLR